MNQEQRAEYLVQTYADTILRLSYSYLKNTADAQDICQEVLLKTLLEAPSFENQSHEKAWILRVAANACKDILKSSWRKRICNIEICKEIPAPDAPSGMLMEEINKLSSKYRTVIYLYYYEGCTAEEIGMILSIRPNTVYSRLARARKILKDNLLDEENIK